MFDILDRQIRLTGNQKKIITAAVIGDALEFFDYFLIGFVLAFLIGPLGLVLIVGSNNYLKPDVPLPEIPTAFLYLGCWFLMAGLVYYFFGMETKGKSIAQIDRELAPA